MKALIFIGIFIVAVVYSYFFPKGSKIFGIDAEILFKKKEDDDFYS